MADSIATVNSEQLRGLRENEWAYGMRGWITSTNYFVSMKEVGWLTPTRLQPRDSQKAAPMWYLKPTHLTNS